MTEVICTGDRAREGAPSRVDGVAFTGDAFAAIPPLSWDDDNTSCNVLPCGVAVALRGRSSGLGALAATSSVAATVVAARMGEAPRPLGRVVIKACGELIVSSATVANSLFSPKLPVDWSREPSVSNRADSVARVGAEAELASRGAVVVVVVVVIVAVDVVVDVVVDALRAA